MKGDYLQKKKALKNQGFFLKDSCGRWDLNPHDCNSHKILSLARLPIPTLPQKKIFRSFFMQEKGLEPSLYCYNRHLKPARLPIPPFLRANSILPDFNIDVNRFFKLFSTDPFLSVPGRCILLSVNKLTYKIPAHIQSGYFIGIFISNNTII